MSLRSGIASSGTRCSDHQPAAAATSDATTTPTRCRAEKSMMWLIMGPHPGLGVEEERARHDYALARLEAVQDLHAIADAAPQRHLLRREVSGAALDEHGVVQPGSNDRLGGHGDGRLV